MSSLILPEAPRREGTRMVIPRAMAEEIRTQAHDAKDTECCGLIGGKFDGDQRVAYLLAACGNHATNPKNFFRIYPWDQYQIEQHFRARGLDIIGLYHSHPRSQAEPSRTDVETIPDSFFSVIYSRPANQLKVWRGSHQVDLEVI